MDKSINSVGLKNFNTARPHVGAVDYHGQLVGRQKASRLRTEDCYRMKSFQGEAVMHAMARTSKPSLTLRAHAVVEEARFRIGWSCCA